MIVEPSGPDGAAEVFFVAGGVVRHRAVVDAAAWSVPVRDGLARLRRHARPPVALLAADALDEASLVEERLRDGADALTLRPGWRTARALEHVGDAVDRIAATARPVDEAMTA